MKIVTIGNTGRYNFHNVADITLHISDEMLIEGVDGGVVGAELTESQIKRISSHFCGISDCECGSSPAGMEYISEDRAVIHFNL